MGVKAERVINVARLDDGSYAVTWPTGRVTTHPTHRAVHRAIDRSDARWVQGLPDGVAEAPPPRSTGSDPHALTPAAPRPPPTPTDAAPDPPTPAAAAR